MLYSAYEIKLWKNCSNCRLYSTISGQDIIGTWLKEENMSDKQQPKKSKTEELLSLDELIAESEESEESLGAEYEPDEQEGPNLEKIIEERDILQDKLMRTLADSENLRKRSIRDRSDAEVYGGTKLARDLLSVYDNITRALDAISDEQRKSNAGLIEGIEWF